MDKVTFVITVKPCVEFELFQCKFFVLVMKLLTNTQFNMFLHNMFIKYNKELLDHHVVCIIVLSVIEWEN